MMTDQDTRDRLSAIGRVAILTNASEQDDDSYVEVTTTDARALLDDHKRLAIENRAMRDAIDTYAARDRENLRAARDMLRRPDELATGGVVTGQTYRVGSEDPCFPLGRPYAPGAPVNTGRSVVVHPDEWPLDRPIYPPKETGQ